MLTEVKRNCQHFAIINFELLIVLIRREICNHFICEAEGEPILETAESRNIRWIAIEELSELLKNNRSKFFIMNVNALEKYLKLNNS